jgi:perosamine synthetase
VGVVSGSVPSTPPPLPYGRQSIDDEDIAAVVEQLRGDWLTQGPAVARFEEAIAAATGAKYAVAVSNGTAALHLACLAAGVGPGDAGVTADITFVASANGIRYAGGVAHLVDVDAATSLMSLRALEAKVEELVSRGKAPRVIIPVDMTGNVADLPAIRRIADRCGALVIEDAAHALGASYSDGGVTYRAGCGVHAQMAILSFHPVKHVTTGEGGAITTNDPALYRALLDLRTHGITKDPARLTRNDGPWYYEQHALGYNYRLTDVQSALGTSQLKKLPRFVARRRELAARYDAAFAEMADRIVPLGTRVGVTHSYHLYVAALVPAKGETLEQVAERRLKLFLGLREMGILPQVHYIPVHRQPDFVRAGMAGGEFPGAERYYAGCLSLPMFPGMKDGNVERVVRAVTQQLGRL